MEETARWDREEHGIQIRLGGVTLEGSLEVPEDPRGVVLFAQGSGGSRHSPRNRFVAEVLGKGGLVTLLLDLLTLEEEAVDRHTGHLRFDIGLLASRLGGARAWLSHHPEIHQLRVGYFGTSTSGGAALLAAAHYPDSVDAIVSGGGRADLAGPALSRVGAPTLLIVGGNDAPAIELNRRALAQLQTEKRLEIVEGATHLFEEPGALEQVAHLACDWFTRYLDNAGQRAVHG